MNQFLELLSDNAQNLVLSAVFLVLIFTLRYVLLRAVLSRLPDDDLVYRTRKLSFYIAAGLLLLILGWIWTRQLANVGSFLGLLSAGIAIALSDVLKNMAAWVLILVRRPFKVGDRIEVGPNAGDVVDIGVFRFSLMEIRNWVDADQTTGRILHIPNGIVFVEPLANYNEGFPFIWLEVPVTVTFESNWAKTQEMVEEVIAGHAVDPDTVMAAASRNQYFSLYRNLDPAVYVKVIDNGVKVTGRLLVPPRGRRLTVSKVWQELLPLIEAAPDMELAYPTTRFFRADLEGTPTGMTAGHHNA
ncbi:MAG: mechanosensitive ion channel [bacterium]|nr:mechanosensitive ion channel family protein [Acidimicrobiia bacterium]MCY4649963.1 mechanosensitive ion channel [bacterium]